MNVRVNGTGLGAYIAGMPFLFYPVILLLICFLIIIGVFPLLGITKKDNELAMQTGIVCSKEESLDGKELHADSANSSDTQTKNNPLKFLATMITIVMITIVTKNVKGVFQKEGVPGLALSNARLCNSLDRKSVV